MTTSKAPFYLLSAFATSAHAGNPAAVIILPPGANLSDAKMQAIAQDLIQPMQAFITPPSAHTESEYGIRWFNADHEARMCVHATLAAAKAVWCSSEQVDELPDVLRFRTALGVVVSARIERESGRIEITFPRAPTAQIAHDSPEGVHIRGVIDKAFGTQESGEPLEVRYIGRGTGQFEKYLLVDIAHTGGFKLEGRKVVIDALVSC